MRLSAKDVTYAVRVLPEASRPIRLRIGALNYSIDATEALALATQLADAVDQFRPPKALEFFNTERNQHD